VLLSFSVMADLRNPSLNVASKLLLDLRKLLLGCRNDLLLFF
jgi:hypothetical protein